MSNEVVAVLTALDNEDDIDDWRVLVDLVQTDPSAVKASTSFGVTALHLAARFLKPEYARLLLSRGADPEARTFSMHDGYVPLHCVVQDSDVEESHLEEELVEILVQAGANSDALDKSGCTPLMHAAQFGRARVAQSLLNAGATAGWEGGSYPPVSMDSVLHIAVSHGAQDVLRVLLEEGCFNDIDDNGKASLRRICSDFNFFECDELLEAYGL